MAIEASSMPESNKVVPLDSGSAVPKEHDDMKHRGKSNVAKIVREAAEMNPIFESHYDPCACGEKNPSGCGLASGLEGLFVADITSRIYQKIQKLKPDWGFHQFVYMPSTRIEGKCGFDVSFGHFENASKRRVRLMHKLIRKWCDADWNWNSNSEDFRPAEHIFKLVTQLRKSEGSIRPYASFSVCYCLHEHRRMGRPGIPPFENIRRSLFVDLSPLRDLLPDNFDPNSPSGYLELMHKAEQEESYISARWNSAHDSIKLQVSDWSEFTRSVTEFLLV